MNNFLQHIIITRAILLRCHKNNQQARRICIISLSHCTPKLACWGGTIEHVTMSVNSSMNYPPIPRVMKLVLYFMFTAMQIINIAILVASYSYVLTSVLTALHCGHQTIFCSRKYL